jgi:sulfate transport system substrate-binding protein
VREGNPKKIKDWDDLVRPGVKRYHSRPQNISAVRAGIIWLLGNLPSVNMVAKTKPKSFVEKLYENVPVLDTGARGSTITFAQRNQGDVLIAWENEAYLLEKEFGAKFDVVVPSISILAEPAVTVVDKYS